MVDQYKIVRASVAGTTVMTIFSYIYSGMEKADLKEPSLLGKMIYRIVPRLSKGQSAIAAWALHYAVGLLFAEMYAQIWQREGCMLGIKSGLLFGALSGIGAIGIWWLVLKKHPAPPPVDFRQHSANLFIAHLIFGVVTAICYKPFHKLAN